MVEIKGINIEAIAGCVPSNIIDNSDYCKELFKDDIKKIIKATGIEKRRFCLENETALDLCVYAANKIFEQNKILKEDIGAVIFVTSTPEYIMPNNATLVQDKLGLRKDILAYDINLACSGYPFGLFNAALTAKATNKKVLLLDGDKQSHLTSKYDKGTGLLFSDGGSATIVSVGVEDLVWRFEFETDGNKHDAIIIEDGGSKNPLKEGSLKYYEIDSISRLRKIDIKMNGLDVFEFATKNVPENIKKLVSLGNIDIANIDILALHQANKFMIRQIAKNLKVPLEKVPMCIEKYGNTSSSTIPLVLNEMYRDNLSNKKILMSGFGAGLSIGSAYIETENTISLGVFEYGK